MWTRLAIRHAPVVAVVCALAAPSAAQTYPVRPVRIVVPFAPGGGTDIVARLLAQKLTEQIGVSFVVENRPGAGATLGAAFVAKAAPDGYTLLMSAPEMSIHPSLRSKLPYDPLKDFAAISQLTSGQFMLASHPSVPVKTVRQLIALAKARPGQLNYGSSGLGGTIHLAGELFRSMAGIRWVHVPFKGAGPAMIGLVIGEVDFMFGSTFTLHEPVRAGRVRVIAMTGPKRLPDLPDLPTIAESGVPGYYVTGWYGFYAPAGTSAEIIQRLHTEARRALNSVDVKETLRKTGNEPAATSPEEFTAFLRAEISKWAKVAKESQLRID